MPVIDRIAAEVVLMHGVIRMFLNRRLAVFQFITSRRR
jgi:hypothetical protein